MTDVADGSETITNNSIFPMTNNSRIQGTKSLPETIEANRIDNLNVLQQLGM